MRRLALTLFVVLLVVFAPTALAGSVATGDGTLVVAGANARIIYVMGSGEIWGLIDEGTLTVINYTPADQSLPQVSGTMTKLTVGSSTQYTGSGIRFLFPNGTYTLRISGSGIGISAVGSKGAVSAIGAGTANDGTMGTNGGTGLQLGTSPTTLVFGSGKAPNFVPSPKALTH